jgi:uncharacterized membrane protein
LYNEVVNYVFWTSEIGIVALFVLCAIVAAQMGAPNRARGLTILLSAVIFAWIFENLNVHQITGRGAYSYNEKFVVFLDRVPLFIVLSWAIILWTAMQISDASSRSLRQRVCRDASLAVLLDLSFDATAIRHEFWTWHGVNFNEAWFGVPAGNFFGWLWVSLAFSYGTRVLEREIKNIRVRHVLQIVVLPPIAFIGYRGLETTTNFVLALLGWNPQNPQTDALSLWAFALVFCVIIILALWPTKESDSIEEANIGSSNSTDFTLRFSQWARESFHIFAVAGLLVLPLWTPFLAQQKPALLAVAGFVFVLDWVYSRALQRRKPTLL